MKHNKIKYNKLKEKPSHQSCTSQTNQRRRSPREVTIIRDPLIYTHTGVP